MDIKSPVFSHKEKIPSEYTCDSDNISPPLIISNIPKNARTIVLICDDPDAPAKTWVHWVAFNIPASEKIIINKGQEPEGISGKNDFDSLGYGGPCPPSGTHRYFFKTFALDIELKLKEGATSGELQRAMQGHVIDNAELIGLYERKNL